MPGLTIHYVNTMQQLQHSHASIAYHVSEVYVIPEFRAEFCDFAFYGRPEQRSEFDVKPGKRKPPTACLECPVIQYSYLYNVA